MTQKEYKKACLAIGWMEELTNKILKQNYSTGFIVSELKELIKELEKN